MLVVIGSLTTFLLDYYDLNLNNRSSNNLATSTSTSTITTTTTTTTFNIQEATATLNDLLDTSKNGSGSTGGSGSWKLRQNLTESPFLFTCPLHRTIASYSCLNNLKNLDEYQSYEWRPTNNAPQDWWMDDRKPSEMLKLFKQVGSLTFYGDSYVRLLFESIICYIQTLVEEIKIERLSTNFDCIHEEMILYHFDSLEECTNKHTVSIYNIYDKNNNKILFNINFIWAPFLIDTKVTPQQKTRDKSNHITLDTTEFPVSENLKDFLLTGKVNVTTNTNTTTTGQKQSQNNKIDIGTLIVYANHHWLSGGYRIPRPKTGMWVTGPYQEMRNLQLQAYIKTQSWLNQHNLNAIIIDEGGVTASSMIGNMTTSTQATMTTNTTIMLPLQYNKRYSILDPPGGLGSSMYRAHWCNEYVPWQLTRILLTTIAKSKSKSKSDNKQSS